MNEAIPLQTNVLKQVGRRGHSFISAVQGQTRNTMRTPFPNYQKLQYRLTFAVCRKRDAKSLHSTIYHWANIISQVWILPGPPCGNPPVAASSWSVSSSRSFPVDSLSTLLYLQAEIPASLAIFIP